MTFSSIAVPSADQGRERRVSKFPARRLLGLKPLRTFITCAPHRKWWQRARMSGSIRRDDEMVRDLRWQVEFKRHPVRARVGQLTSRRRIREFC
jgi:hypothetical protein